MFPSYYLDLWLPAVVLIADSIARLVFAVPNAHGEEVMYFVGPAFTMFVSVPVAIVALFLPLRGERERK